MISKRLLLIRTGIIAMGLLAAVFIYMDITASHRRMNQDESIGQTDPSIKIGGPFSLSDQYGHVVTQDVLKGHWSAVFFGYTYCPDICPLSLQTLAGIKKELGDKGRDLQILFISIDPKRDTPKTLAAYLNSGGFPDHVMGLSGTDDQIKAVTKAYRVTYEKVGSGSTYSFNHSSTIYVMNPKGEFAIPLAQGLGVKDSAQALKKEMEAWPN